MQGRMRGQVHDVRKDISHRVSTSLSLGDLFYPPSAQQTRDEKRLMNNRGGDGCLLLVHPLPQCDPTPHPPLFFYFNCGTKKDFINNLRDFLGCAADVGGTQRAVVRDTSAVSVREKDRNLQNVSASVRGRGIFLSSLYIKLQKQTCRVFIQSFQKCTPV